MCGLVGFHLVDGTQDGLVIRPDYDVCACVLSHVMVECFVYGKQFFCVYRPFVLVTGPEVLVRAITCYEGITLVSTRVCDDVCDIGGLRKVEVAGGYLPFKGPR